jgi:Ca-activated chloride channel family protein
MPQKFLHAVAAVLLCGAAAALAGEYDVRITLKPRGLSWGEVTVPVSAGPGVETIRLYVNGVASGEARGRAVAFRVPIGKYLRRLRIRAVGHDASGAVVGADEMTVNDPQPPFRVRLTAPPAVEGVVELNATVLSPPNVPLLGVDFYAGETLLHRDDTPPYSASFDASIFPDLRYARAVARAPGALEAHDVFFWGDVPHETVEVIVKHIPISFFGERSPPAKDDLTLIDSGVPRQIEALVPAADQPLNVILLIDSSESMLEELPILQRAAKEFARSAIRRNDRIAVVAFHERLFWLTGFTSNHDLIDAAIDRLQPRGRTHLYDAAISTLYELQKMPGRKALVVLTDGMNSGGVFELDHLVHYARYAGVPVYPIVKNKWLSRLMRLRLGMMEAKRFAEIARDSGASYFIIERPSQLPAVYQAIADELRKQYLLVFRAESTGSDAWHSLALRGSRRGNIRIPSGYFP